MKFYNIYGVGSDLHLIKTVEAFLQASGKHVTVFVGKTMFEPSISPGAE